LNGFFLAKLYEALPAAHQSWTPAAACILLMLLGALLAHLLERDIIIVATAMGGAYATGWGIDRLAYSHAKHNLNPLVLFTGNGCSQEEWCYIELACMIVFAIIGIFVQYKKTADKSFSKLSRRQQEEEQAYYEHLEEPPAVVIISTRSNKSQRTR